MPFLFSHAVSLNRGAVTPGPGPGPGVDQFDITITSGTVDADLTGFPVYIDLADMPASFWSTVDADGGDIRMYESDGVTQLPFDLVSIDSGTETGVLFVRTDVAMSADTVIRLALEAGSELLPVGDAFGRNATWQDYEAVVLFTGDFANRTGNGDLVKARDSLGWPSSAGPTFANTILGGGLDTTADPFAVTSDNTLANSSQFTVAATVAFDLTASDATALAVNYGTADGGTSAAFVGKSGTSFTFQTSNGQNLTGGTVVDGVYNRIHGTGEDGPDNKQLFVNGVLVNSASQNIFSHTRDSIVIGRYQSGAVCRGVIGFVYIRGGILPAEWIAAEVENLNDTASFYSVSEAG